MRKPLLTSSYVHCLLVFGFCEWTFSLWSWSHFGWLSLAAAQMRTLEFRELVRVAHGYIAVGGQVGLKYLPEKPRGAAVIATGSCEIPCLRASPESSIGWKSWVCGQTPHALAQVSKALWDYWCLRCHGFGPSPPLSPSFPFLLTSFPPDTIFCGPLSRKKQIVLQHLQIIHKLYAQMHGVLRHTSRTWMQVLGRLWIWEFRRVSISSSID